MRIVITGTPGTGKTKVAEELADILGVKLIPIKKVVEREIRKKEVDIKKLEKILKKMLKNERNYVIEGHLACEVKIPCDYIFVLRTHPDELKGRLSKRKYPAAKREENLMSEMLDYCVQRTRKVYGIKPIEIDTSGKTVNETAKRIAGMIKNKKKKGDNVDYSKEMLEYLGLKKHGRRKKTY